MHMNIVPTNDGIMYMLVNMGEGGSHISGSTVNMQHMKRSTSLFLRLNGTFCTESMHYATHINCLLTFMTYLDIQNPLVTFLQFTISPPRPHAAIFH